MQRYYQDQEKGISASQEIIRRTAFHEAGHAAAIFLENQRKNLPSIYFYIDIHNHNQLTSPALTRICGGRQIDDVLMIGRAAAVGRQDLSTIADYQVAYEADIINLLAGPLAEAKYVFLRDNKIFNVNLLKPDALQNYGGNADMKEVRFYLESLLPSLQEQDTKLNQLFAEAFRFVQNAQNWKRIAALANYILDSSEEQLGYEQVEQVLHQNQEYANIAGVSCEFSDQFKDGNVSVALS